VIVLAFDPGPHSTAFALVQGDERQQQVVESGKVLSAAPELKALLVRVATRDARLLVAVETVAGYLAHPARAASLFETARVAGLILGLAHPCPTFTLPANATGSADSWRLRLCRNPRAGDAQVRRALTDRRVRVRGLSTHERDAVGLGVVTLLSSRVIRRLYNLEAA
jgi:hypothetical protein